MAETIVINVTENTETITFSYVANGETVTITMNEAARGATGPAGTTTWAGITDKPSTFTPTAHKASHAAGGSDALTPADIGAAPSYPRAIAVTGTLTDGTDSVVFPVMTVYAESIGYPFYKNGSYTLTPAIANLPDGSVVFYGWSLVAPNIGGGTGGIWYSSTDTKDPTTLVDLAPTAPSTGSPGVTSADITTIQIVTAAIGGAPAKITDITGGFTTNHVTLSNSPTSVPTTEGTLSWNVDDHTINIQTDISGVIQQVGQEQIVRVKNVTASTIDNGKAVYLSGASGQRPTIALASASVDAHVNSTIGVATHDIGTAPGFGYVTTSGLVRGVNTQGMTEGAAIYLGESGAWSTTEPTNANKVRLGWVVIAGNNGTILVHVEKLSVRLTDTHAGASLTSKTTLVDADSLILVNSEDANKTQRGTLTNLKTWLGTWIDALATIAGAKTLSGQLQLTGQSATDTNSAMTIGMEQAMSHRYRDTWVGSILAASGTGSAQYRTSATTACDLDGALATTATSGSYVKATIVRSALFGDYNDGRIADFRVKWTQFCRARFQVPTNTEVLLGIAYDASAGEPTTGGSNTNCGLRIWNNSGTITAHLWKQVAGTVTTGSDVTAAPLTSILKTQNGINSYDVLIWLENTGTGTMNCYMELVADGSNPAVARPAVPLCTITGLPSGFSVGGGVSTLAMRATGTPGANSAFQVNDSKFFYF